MGLIFNDLNNALSVKSCYSRGLFSSAVIVLTILLMVSLLVSPGPREEVQAALTSPDIAAALQTP